jgi:uncharacterized membrane protein YedE/YeeE
MTSYLLSLIGGMLIGLAAIMLLILNGRIAGVSGIVGRLAQGVQLPTNSAFVVGLVLGPVAYRGIVGHWPDVTIIEPLPIIVLAGLLVGFGTRMGSGCTSGHGVLGIARISPRSMAAVATFLAAGVVAVAILRSVGL